MIKFEIDETNPQGMKLEAIGSPPELLSDLAMAISAIWGACCNVSPDCGERFRSTVCSIGNPANPMWFMPPLPPKEGVNITILNLTPEQRAERIKRMLSDALKRLSDEAARAAEATHDAKDPQNPDSENEMG